MPSHLNLLSSAQDVVSLTYHMHNNIACTFFDFYYGKSPLRKPKYQELDAWPDFTVSSFQKTCTFVFLLYLHCLLVIEIF